MHLPQRLVLKHSRCTRWAARRRGHDLAALFRALPAQLQAQIRTETSVPSPRWDASFDQDLAMVANAFEVWRYIYEKHPVDTDLGFLQRLAGAIDVALDTIT